MSLHVDIRRRLGSFTLDVALTAENGVTSLLGASGCGKSMTLKCIAGIEKPDEGVIELDGRTLYDSAKGINLPPQARRVGYLFQNYALFPNMTVAQNILCGLSREKDRAAKQRRLREMLRMMQLEGLEERKPAQLSGGQQQRTALARILVSDPQILLLDEPFSALDGHLRDALKVEMRDLLQRFGREVLMVTHDRSEAYNMSREIAVMDAGRVLTQKPTKALFADFRVQPLDKVCALGGDAPVAFAALAGTAQMAAEREQRRCCDIARVRTERYRLYNVRRRTDGAADDQRHIVADALVPQPLVHRRQSQLNRDAHMIADTGRRRTGAAAKAVDGNDIRAGARHAAGDGCNIMDRRHLHNDGLLAVGRFLERIDQLPQVFNRIDVVVRRRRDGVRSFRNHPRARDVTNDLCAGQMAADPGLCALAHFDLDGGAGVQIVFIHAEPSGRHLHNGVRAVAVKVLMQSAFARVIQDSECFGCRGKRCVRVVADGAVAHGGKHHRHGKRELRLQIRQQLSVCAAPQHVRLFAQKDARFGIGFGLPIEDSSTPPVFACL